MNKHVLELAQTHKAGNGERSAESSRFVDTLKKHNLSCAFANGLTLAQLSDFVEKVKTAEA